MTSFEITVACNSGGTEHSHSIVVESRTGAFGASRPTRVRLQYTCPVSGTPLIATFEPPVGAARPFEVAEVR